MAAIAMELSVPTQACKVIWAELAWPFIILMPTAWSFFLYEYALIRNVGRAVAVVGVVFHPLFILVASSTNDFHGLLYGPDTRLVVQNDISFVIYDHGPLYFLAITFLYTIIAISCAIAWRAARQANPAVKGFFKKLFLVTAIPVAFSMSYDFFGFMIFGMDPTPLSFAFSICMVGWMIIDNRWVDVNAIARDLLYYNSRELIFVLDVNGALIETNHSAKQLMQDQGITHDCVFAVEGMVPRVYRMSLGQGQRLLGWAVSFVDITSQKAAAERAIASERLQSQFLSTVSHELRTPLTVINGSLQMLTHNRANTSPEQADRLIELATKNAATLAKLVNDLLETQRLENSDLQLKLDKCDLDEIILDAVDGMETFLPEKHIKILYKRELRNVEILADCDRLRQVIVNVLSNAMKFSKPRSFVEVHLSVEAGLALVDVRDFGLGIPPGAEDTVFGRFTQVDATDTKAVYGSGLGMHISKQLMVRHGGNIHYVSELGVGTTFTITIPVTPETLT